jgi:hypothetical protein
VPHRTAVSTAGHACLSAAAMHDATVGFGAAQNRRRHGWPCTSLFGRHARCDSRVWLLDTFGLWHRQPRVLSDGRRGRAAPKTTQVQL